MKIITVGRNPKNDVVIDDADVSRFHLQIIKENSGSIRLVDLDSTNGTFVNNRRVRGTVTLRINDMISLGNKKIVLKWQDYLSDRPVNQPVPKEEPIEDTASKIKPLLYDVGKDPEKVYGTYEQRILSLIDAYQQMVIDTEEKVAPTNYSQEVLALAINEYRKNFNSLSKMVQSVENECALMKKEYDDDMQKFENLYQYTLISNKDANAAMSTINMVNAKKAVTKSLYEKTSNEVTQKIETVVRHFDGKHPVLFPHKYELATSTDSVWTNSERNTSDLQNILYLGERNMSYDLLGNTFRLTKREYQPFVVSKNLLFRYNRSTKQECFKVVNSIVGRMLMALPSGLLQIYTVDASDFEVTSNEFKQIHRDIFKVYSQPTEIAKLLDFTMQHVENVKQNLLYGENADLSLYNINKTNKEPYRIIIIKDFPSGIYGEAVIKLKKILSVGEKTGVAVMLLINDDEVNRSDDSLKSYRMLDVESLGLQCSTFNFVTSEYPFAQCIGNVEMKFDVLSDNQLAKIVNAVNKGLETKTETVVNLIDYVPKSKEWWTGTSTSLVEIPFGVSSNKAIVRLRITQESGQNSAVVIGIPGSGKSVFLHSIIINAAIKYSPKELQMYLLDFSGVEFNTYATHKLPHARVIAPEAEREFGLSVLKELREEGVRRMNLCRENDVTNIVELRKKDESLALPRIMVIIDEFQKIFEVENDAISKEANSIIHIIIQEYRKFGINLILATQRVPSSYVLPKDLIANRVVFKSTPGDFSALISWDYGVALPAMKTGQCIYNAESGAAYANELAQGFYISKSDIDKILEELKDRAVSTGNDKVDLLVFRGNDLPDVNRLVLPKGMETQYSVPETVPACLGQSIAISETDVFAALQKESSNNILIVGGEKDVAQKIALYATLSTTISHVNDSAKYYLFNFMRPTDQQYTMPVDHFGKVPFDVSFIEKMSDVKDTLASIKNIIEERKQDENIELSHIYLSFFAFQLARVFDKGGRRGDDVSEEGQLLDYIIKQGPAMGVFTLLQVDKLESLNRIGTPLSYFMHRVLLQMTENESIKLMDSPLASKLYVINRPSSKYRAFYREQNRNITIKFKPYK